MICNGHTGEHIIRVELSAKTNAAVREAAFPGDG